MQDDDERVRRAIAGDRQALDELFARHRKFLERSVLLRMDRRLQQRFDPDDVVNEALLEAAHRLGYFAEHEATKRSFRSWLRYLALQKVVQYHRQHLSAGIRNADREISLYAGPMPEASSVWLAEFLLGHGTPVSQQAMRAELLLKVQEAVNSLEPVDREILVMRYFEQLSNVEVAHELQLTPGGASKRFFRAAQRMRDALQKLGAFEDLSAIQFP